MITHACVACVCVLVCMIQFPLGKWTLVLSDCNYSFVSDRAHDYCRSWWAHDRQIRETARRRRRTHTPKYLCIYVLLLWLALSGCCCLPCHLIRFVFVFSSRRSSITHTTPSSPTMMVVMCAPVRIWFQFYLARGNVGGSGPPSFAHSNQVVHAHTYTTHMRVITRRSRFVGTDSQKKKWTEYVYWTKFT